jgi:hypothetical protein
MEAIAEPCVVIEFGICMRFGFLANCHICSVKPWLDQSLGSISVLNSVATHVFPAGTDAQPVNLAKPLDITPPTLARSVPRITSTRFCTSTSANATP